MAMTNLCLDDIQQSLCIIFVLNSLNLFFHFFLPPFKKTPTFMYVREAHQFPSLFFHFFAPFKHSYLVHKCPGIFIGGRNLPLPLPPPPSILCLGQTVGEGIPFTFAEGGRIHSTLLHLSPQSPIFFFKTLQKGKLAIN
jgi:hypothetical protein